MQYINKVYIHCTVLYSCHNVSTSDYMTAGIVVQFVMTVLSIPTWYLMLRAANTGKLGDCWMMVHFLSYVSPRQDTKNIHGVWWRWDTVPSTMLSGLTSQWLNTLLPTLRYQRDQVKSYAIMPCTNFCVDSQASFISTFSLISYVDSRG